jgi:hypothetical protein
MSLALWLYRSAFLALSLCSLAPSLYNFDKMICLFGSVTLAFPLSLFPFGSVTVPFRFHSALLALSLWHFRFHFTLLALSCTLPFCVGHSALLAASF